MALKIFFNSAQVFQRVNPLNVEAEKHARFMELVEDQMDSASFNLAPFTPASKEDLYLVHDKAYVDEVLFGDRINGTPPVDKAVSSAHLWSIGSLIGATLQSPHEKQPVCSCAPRLDDAGYDWGSNNCIFNGLMIAAAKFLQMHSAAKVGIFDFSYPKSNGVADVLCNNPELAKRIIYRNTDAIQTYPTESRTSISSWLEGSIEELNSFGCDLVLFQASADLHVVEDGGSFVGENAMRLRDAMVLRKIKAPIAWNLGGGISPIGKRIGNFVLRAHLNALLISSKCNKS
jgi:hypothetical protein